MKEWNLLLSLIHWYLLNITVLHRQAATQLFHGFLCSETVLIGVDYQVFVASFLFFEEQQQAIEIGWKI